MSLFRVPLNTRNGARVQVRVSLSRPTIISRRQAGQAIPQSIVVEALIDTGAERSCIDPTVAARASLTLYGFGFGAAPGTPAPAIPAFGGATVNARYEAGLAILHPGNQSDLVVPDIILEALPLRSFGIEAVIGRDVLSQCVLVYDGPAGSVTLAY